MLSRVALWTAEWTVIDSLTQEHSVSITWPII